MASGDAAQLAARGRGRSWRPRGRGEAGGPGYAAQLAARGTRGELWPGGLAQLAASGRGAGGPGYAAKLAVDGQAGVAAGIGGEPGQGQKGTWVVLAEWIWKDDKRFGVRQVGRIGEWAKRHLVSAQGWQVRRGHVITPEQIVAMRTVAETQALDWANRSVALQQSHPGLASYAETIKTMLTVFANAAGRAA